MYSAPTGPPPTKEYVERARQGSSAAPELSVEVAAPSPSAPSHSGLVREYTVWPSKNSFCCWGHCMTGPDEDVGPNTCAWLTVLSPMALFFYVWGERLAETSSILLMIP